MYYDKNQLNTFVTQSDSNIFMKCYTKFGAIFVMKASDRWLGLPDGKRLALYLWRRRGEESLHIKCFPKIQFYSLETFYFSIFVFAHHALIVQRFSLSAPSHSTSIKHSRCAHSAFMRSENRSAFVQRSGLIHFYCYSELRSKKIIIEHLTTEMSVCS